MKKIAFVATAYILKYDGISVYTENLLLEFLKEINNTNEVFNVDIYTGESVLKLLTKRISKEDLLNDRIKIKAVKDNKFTTKILHLNYQLIKNGKYDLIFMPNFMPTLFLPSKTLKVIHDFSVNNFPELFSKGYLKYHDMLLKYAKYFDYAIGYISKSTLKDLNKFHNINNSNKTLIHLENGIPFKVKNYKRPFDEEIYNKYQKKEIEFLVVGRINKHKGFDRIIDFCKYFDNSDSIAKYSKITLNIVGKQTKETENIFKNLNLKNINLVFHGFLYDEQLNELYKTSHFCLFLSRNEGYGLPLVEAMWFKSIPIISNIPIFKEILSLSYPMFDEKTNFTSAIVEFIDRIMNDNDYLESKRQHLETITQKEKAGYKNSAKKLVTFIKGIK